MQVKGNIFFLFPMESLIHKFTAWTSMFRNICTHFSTGFAYLRKMGQALDF